MIDINETNNEINRYSENTHNLINEPSRDSRVLSIFKNNNITDEDATDSISNGISLLASLIMSKTGFYELIKFRLNDNEALAKKVFKEFDNTILIPNNIVGLVDEDDGATDDTKAKDLTPQTTTALVETQREETAEDILREIENPTLSILPIIQNPILPQTTFLKKEEIKESFVGTSDTQTQEQTQVQSQSRTNPTETEQPTPNKETQIDSKLTGAVVLPVKSTYYKLDPYREKAE